jgi:transcriptional regulator with XRE-family HTH domain
MENLIFFGETVKALGDGKVGGYLVRFSDASTPDLTGDYFTKSTEFFIDDGAKLPVLYNHGFDSVLKRRKIGVGMVKSTDIGLWFEAQLSLRDEYEKKVYELAEKGKLGYSSGAAGHLTSRKNVGGANEILEWGLAEASLTPTPAEFRNQVVTLKSYIESNIQPKPTKISTTLNQYLDDLVDSGKDRANILANISQQTGLSQKMVSDILEGRTKPTAAKLKGFARALEVDESLLMASVNLSPKTIKGMFEDELAERTPSVWELWNAYCCVTQKLAMAAVSTQATGVEFDLEAKVDESTSEYVDRLKAQVLLQIASYTEAGSMDEPFYLKAIIDLAEGDLLSAKHLDIDQHSELAVSALKEIVARFKANHEARKSQKAGRVLSQKNRERLAQMLEQIKAAVSDCQTLLDESMPMASADDTNAAKTALAKTKWKARSLGVTL